MGETKIIYHLDDQETPYLIKLPLPAEKVTLHDLKTALNKPSHKYFFKSMDDDFGVVKEEIIDDNAHLPCYNGRVVTWLVSAEGSSHSDTQSLVAETNGSAIAASPTKPSQKPVAANNNTSQNRNSPSKASVKDCTAENGQGKGPQQQQQQLMNGYQHHVQVHRPARGPRGAPSSVMSSDIETTSFVDSDDDASTRITTTTETTHRSSHFNKRRRRKHRLPVISRASSFSSITDSTMSLNIVTVQLNMDTANFLGISIVGQSNKGGDGGIYVGSIMKGGAVAQDGRIEPGDMILEVNGVSFENMSNDEAVRTLRQAVQRTGPITLVVAKCWDPNPRGYAMLPPPRQEPIRPIDPSAWVMHTEAVRQQGAVNGGANWGPYGGGGQWGGGRGWGPMGAPSMSTLTSTSSSLISSIPANEYVCKPQHSSATSSSSHSSRSYTDLNLNKHTDMAAVVRAMAQPDSGLEVRDRQWLKISIPHAFIGSELVDWLHTRVEGFADRRDARRYACNLLKAGFIQHTVNKLTFSEQCYYIFGSNVPPVNMADLSLDDIDSVSSVGMGSRPVMYSGGADQDSLGPLPTPPAWNSRPIQSFRPPPLYMPGAMGPGASNGLIPPYATPAGLQGGGADSLSYVSMPGVNGAESVVSGSAKHDKTCACIVSHTYKQIRRLWDNPDKSNAQQNTMRMLGKFDADIDRSTSSDTGSSDSESSQSNLGAVKQSAQKPVGVDEANRGVVAPKWPPPPPAADRGLPPPPPPRELDKSKNSELDASRQSFRMAMGNTITDDTLHVMGDL